MAYFPPNQDTTTSGSISALSGAVTLAVSSGQTSWSVQATGTFVGTFETQVTVDGSTWIPVNSRQSGGGALQNSFNGTGIFRGSCGGVASFRVICTAYTSGTAVVTIRLGVGVGAIFSNSVVLVQDQVQYYSSTAGKNRGYNATVGVQSILAAGGNVALFRNPSGSLVDAYIESFALGTNTAGRIERYRAPTITSVTTAVTEINRGGSANTASAKLYVPAQFVSSSNGNLAKVSFLQANMTETSREAGSLILRPGQDILFRFDPDGGGASTVSIEIVWWESGLLT